MFSIVIPTFNRSKFIGGAIKSVLAQTYGNWELIVVDDGSTDNTKEVVLSFNDSRIRYIYQDNAERSAARNRGIKESVGIWVCFLDSDDEYLPNHLSVMTKLIDTNKSNNGMYASGIFRVNNGTRIKHPLLNLKSSEILKEIMSIFLLPTQVCVSKSILDIHKFNNQFRLWEDTHLWLRIVQEYPIYQGEEYTCIQNVHDQSTVTKGMDVVKLEDVKQYVNAILHFEKLQRNDCENYLSNKEIIQYIDDKYRMYLYKSRQNKQIKVALTIWFFAIRNKSSWYLLSEFLKIFLNKFGIGINAK